jgi:hypothetical protein
MKHNDGQYNRWGKKIETGNVRFSPEQRKAVEAVMMSEGVFAHLKDLGYKEGWKECVETMRGDAKWDREHLNEAYYMMVFRTAIKEVHKYAVGERVMYKNKVYTITKIIVVSDAPENYYPLYTLARYKGNDIVQDVPEDLLNRREELTRIRLTAPSAYMED